MESAQKLLRTGKRLEVRGGGLEVSRNLKLPLENLVCDRSSS